MIRKYLLFFMLFFIYCTHSYAQSCTNNFAAALKAYEDGELRKIESLIARCLHSQQLNDDEKIRAHKILIIAFLYLDETAAAEKYMVSLLKTYPDFVPVVEDPYELFKLYNEYRTSPYLSVGFTGGVNMANAVVSNKYGTHNLSNDASDYSAKLGTQLGVHAEMYLMRNLYLTAELLSVRKKYSYYNQYFDYSEIRFTETQNSYELPVTLKFMPLNINKITPFIELGGSISLLNKSVMSELNRTNFVDSTARPVDGQDIILTNSSGNLRRKINYSFIAGIGAMYKVPHGFISLKMRYNWGIYNVVNTTNRFANDELVYRYGYIDNDFRINNFSISLGYMYSFYKPKKLKKKNDE